jgi:hypothetical protein
LRSVAGKDATKNFNKHHNPKILERYRDELKVGVLREEKDEKKKKNDKESGENKKEVNAEKTGGGPRFKFLKWRKS